MKYSKTDWLTVAGALGSIVSVVILYMSYKKDEKVNQVYKNALQILDTAASEEEPDPEEEPTEPIEP